MIDVNLVPKVTLPGGEKVPAVGMGTFGSDKYAPAVVSAAVKGAIEYGYRMFDCASVYGNEELIGEVLMRPSKRAPSSAANFLSRRRCGTICTAQLMCSFRLQKA